MLEGSYKPRSSLTWIVIKLGSRVWEGGGVIEKSEASTYSYCDAPKKSGVEKLGKFGE